MTACPAEGSFPWVPLLLWGAVGIVGSAWRLLQDPDVYDGAAFPAVGAAFLGPLALLWAIMWTLRERGEVLRAARAQRRLEQAQQERELKMLLEKEGL